MYAEIDGSIFRDTCSLTIHPLVQLCGGVAYILFFTFSARDKILEDVHVAAKRIGYRRLETVLVKNGLQLRWVQVQHLGL